VALAALDDMLGFLDAGGEIGIYDATNNTRERRALVGARCAAEVVFVESICNDPATIEANIRATRARSPDYEGVAEEEAVRDFRLRIAHYENGCEEVGEDEGPFIKIIDVGREDARLGRRLSGTARKGQRRDGGAFFSAVRRIAEPYRVGGGAATLSRLVATEHSLQDLSETMAGHRVEGALDLPIQALSESLPA
jgi:hypothetical protein